MAVCTIAHRASQAPARASRRGREADLLEQRFEVVARGRNAGEDPRPRSAGPTGLPPEARAPPGRRRGAIATPRASRSRTPGEATALPPRAGSAICAPPARALRPAPSSCCARRPEPPGARRPRRARRLPCRSSAPGGARTGRASTSKSASAAPCTREPSRRSAARAAPSMPRVPRRPGSGIPSGIAPPRGASRRSSGLDRE